MTRSELVCGIWTVLYNRGFTPTSGELYAEAITDWLLDSDINLKDMQGKVLINEVKNKEEYGKTSSIQ